MNTGDRAAGWLDGIPYTGVVTGIQPHHPGSGDHLHITVRRADDGTEVQTFTDAVGPAPASPETGTPDPEGGTAS